MKTLNQHFAIWYIVEKGNYDMLYICHLKILSPKYLMHCMGLLLIYIRDFFEEKDIIYHLHSTVYLMV